MNTIANTRLNSTRMKKSVHLDMKAICARMKRIESIGIGACGTIIVLLVGILVSICKRVLCEHYPGPA
jgi:hypothetical protein